MIEYAHRPSWCQKRPGGRWACADGCTMPEHGHAGPPRLSLQAVRDRRLSHPPKPCPKGHAIELRYVTSGGWYACRECKRALDRSRQQRHNELRRQRKEEARAA